MEIKYLTIKKIMNVFFLCLFIFSCKSNEEKKVIINNNTSPSVNKSNINQIKNSINEIYIGKTFFSGDELNDLTVVENKKIEQIDSLTYSIYKKNNSENYIFSLEKFLKNEDVEKYKIIDTINLKSKDIIIDLKNLNNLIVLSLKTQGSFTKEWKFKDYNFKEWKGFYEGTFLRLKEESGDPRGKGQIKIEINSKNAKLNIDSYVENVEINLELVNNSNDEIVFKELSSNKKVVLTRKADKILLEGDIIESIVGVKEKI